LQNKANFRKGQINISIFSTKDYEKIAHLETPAKQSQTKPIAGLWPEVRSTNPEILNSLAASTAFRKG
jgi:hypothetical protein